MGIFANAFTWWNGASWGTMITSRRNGEEVGDEGGTCPIVDVEQGLIHCTGTIRLPGGQLTFQGLTTTAPTKLVAITGGTGRYKDATGSGSFQGRLPANSTVYEFTLTGKIRY